VEQVGYILVESMACGVPVIGSSSGAIPETIGNAGLIFPEGSDIALAEAILRIGSDVHLRDELIAKGVNRLRDLYSCESYADSLSKLFPLK